MTNHVLAILGAGLAALATPSTPSTSSKPLTPSMPLTPSTSSTPPHPQPHGADMVVDYGFTSVEGFGPGTEYGFAMSMTNNGPADATGATLVIVVPPMLTVPSPPTGCTVDGPGLICELDEALPAGATVDFAGRARLDDDYTGDGSDIVRTAIVWSDVADPDDTNNTVTAVGPRIEG